MWYCVGALEKLLGDNDRPWAPWTIPSNTRVVLVGHSNGGQGAWHIAERFPDRVVAGKWLSYPIPEELMLFYQLSPPLDTSSLRHTCL